MIQIIEISYFVAYLLLILAFYALTKKGKARWQQIRKKEHLFSNLCIFMWISFGIFSAFMFIWTGIENEVPKFFDDWFDNFTIVIPAFTLAMGAFFFFFSATEDEKWKDRTELSGKPAEKRPWYFYLILFFLFPLLPAILCPVATIPLM